MTKTNRILVTFILSLLGIVLLLLQIQGIVGILASNVGLAFIVAGVYSFFNELFIQRSESDELATKVIRGMEDLNGGIRLLSQKRKGMEGYYSWVMQHPKKMMMAGRSVLNRMDFDMRAQGIGRIEELLARKVNEGAEIYILFLDPRCDIIERLAREENQTRNAILSDLAVSVGICERLCALLGTTRNHTQGSLHIRVYNEVPYFAYHRVDDHAIIGFYFSSAVGHSSAAYEVLDPQSRHLFESHFTSILAKTKDTFLIEALPHRTKPEFNKHLVEEFHDLFREELGTEKTELLLSGKAYDHISAK